MPRYAAGQSPLADVERDPSTTPVGLRRATPADAARLAAFAARLFRETYAPSADPAHLDQHVARAFGPARQGAELADPAITTLLAEADGVLVAYAQLRRGPAPPAVAGPEPVELLRFYVDRPWHGRGLAQTLLAATEAAAHEVSGRTLWLSVWEGNARARAFYARAGFVEAGHHPFHFGPIVEMDPVMVKALD